MAVHLPRREESSQWDHRTRNERSKKAYQHGPSIAAPCAAKNPKITGRTFIELPLRRAARYTLAYEQL